MLRLLLPAALCVAAAGPVHARTFHLLPAAASGWTVIDPSAIERLPGGVIRRTWVVSVQRSIVDGGAPQPGYVRTLTEYDCATRETRWRSFSAFSRNGMLVLTRENATPTWTRADDSAAVDAEMHAVCGDGATGSEISGESIARVVIALMATWDGPPTLAGVDAPSKAVPAKAPPAKEAAKPAPKSKTPPAAKPKAP